MNIGDSSKSASPSPLSAKNKAEAGVALEVLRASDDNLLQPGFAEQTIDWASSSFELSPKDHVLLLRAANDMRHQLQVRDPKAAREAAATVLSHLASASGTAPGELVATLGEQLSAASAQAKTENLGTAGLGKGLTLDAEALAAWNTLMGRVGQWEAKEFLSDLLQKAQLNKMLGETHIVGSKHFMVVGDAGSGKSTFAPLFAPILHSLGYTRKNSFVAATGSDFHGINSGEIAKHVDEIFEKGKDGVIFIDEIQSLTTQGSGSWSSSVYGAINAKLTDPAYKDTVVIFGGYPYAAENLKDRDSGLARRLPTSNRIFLANLNVDELVERFVQLADELKLTMPRESIAAVRNVLGRVSQTSSFGNAGFVANLVEYCRTRMADRIARQPDCQTVELQPEDIALPPNTYYPCAFTGGAPVTSEALRTQLSQNVVGQSAAIDALVESMMNRYYLPPNTDATRKPVFRLHFMGPSGSGKSLLAAEAAKLFMSPEDLEAHRKPPVFEISANTLESFKRYLAGPERIATETPVESPLLEWMKTAGGGVICINEVDKGPDDLMRTLMEIFDTGKFTPNSGREFDFSNFGIVLTSNFGNEIGLFQNHADARAPKPPTDPKPGEVNGLAAFVADDVQVGGSTLNVVAVADEGTGRVEIKSNARQTMIESAEIGLKYLQTHAEKLGADPAFFKTHDFMIGISGAATPKDGPSAGITMATAILSTALDKAVPPNIAMTGELTLTGTVEAVGGIQEKVLGAFEQGIETIIVSEKNRPDVEQLPASLREAMHFEFAQDLSDVLRAAFAKRPATVHSTLPAELYQQVSELRAEAYMQRKWPAEVLGRFDTSKPVVFKALSSDEIRAIVRRKVEREAEDNLRERGLSLISLPALEDRLLAQWDQTTGARPVLQSLTREVIVPLLQARTNDPGSYPVGTQVKADVVNGEVTFTPEAQTSRDQKAVADWLQASTKYQARAIDPNVPEKPKAVAEEIKWCDRTHLAAARDESQTPNDRINEAVKYITSGEQLTFEDALDLLTGMPRGSDAGWYGEALKGKNVMAYYLTEWLGLGSWSTDGHAADLSITLATLDRVKKPLSTKQKEQLGKAARKVIAESSKMKEHNMEANGDLFSAVELLLNTDQAIAPKRMMLFPKED